MTRRTVFIALAVVTLTSCSQGVNDDGYTDPNGAVPVVDTQVAPDASHALLSIRMGVPDGELAIPPVPGTYSDAEIASLQPTVERYNDLSLRMYTAARSADSWEAAYEQVTDLADSAPPSVPRYLVEQTVSVAMAQRDDAVVTESNVGRVRGLVENLTADGFGNGG